MLIRGLLIEDGTQVLHLIFMCPKCNTQHGCLVNDIHYYNGSTNIWAFKQSVEEDNIIELFPSFNNEKYCGWQSEYNWSVEIMYLQKGQNRSVAHEKWLRGE